MDEHTMKLLLRQQQQLLGNAFNADAANLLPQQSIIQQQTNFAAAMTNTMCTTGASSNHTGGDIGLGTFTQNDRITPPLPHAQQLQRQQQQQQQQQLLLQSQQQQQLSHMPSSSTAAANNNLFAGIDPTQMMHLPQSSQNTILQRQYQPTADRIAEEHKARAIQIAGQRVNGAAGTINNANANAASSSGGTAHQFLQSLQNDTTTRGLHANIANANNATTNDALLAVDMDAEADVDASDPLMASLQMYSQYGEDSTPLAVNAMGGGGAGNHFSNGHNGQLQTNNNNNNNMYGGNGFGALSTNNGGGVGDKLQQLQTIQAQLTQLQRMEIEMKQQAEAQEKQLRQQRQLQLQQLQQQQQQQQSSVTASASATASAQSAGRLTPPTNNGNGESSGGATTPLSPPSLPVDAAMSDAAAQGMRAKVQQYEAAARSMLLQEGKRRRSKIDASTAATATTAAASATTSTSTADTGTKKVDVPSSAAIAQAAVSSPRHHHHHQQQQQRRRSSVVSDGSSSIGDETPGRKRRSPERSWRDIMKDDPDVQECRAKMRRRVEHYVANCMLSDKAPAAAASNAPFRRVLASKLEERLYGAAPTFEQYSDSTTLEARLKILAMQIGKRIEGEPGKRKRRRMAATKSADAKTTGDDGGSDSGSTGGNSVASVVEDDTNKLMSLRDYVGEDKYATIVQVVEEIRTIRRTSDVWMSSDSANRQPGTTCNTKPRQAFPASGLEAASAIVGDGISTSNKGTDYAISTSEKKSTTFEETKENSTADEVIEPTAAADRKVNIIRPGSPDELSAVESMPRALTNIYFSTRLVAASTALGPSHHGSSAQVEDVDWDRLLTEAKTNLKAFRILEESTAGSDRQSFVEVCTLSGNCRLEQVDS